MSDFWPDCGYRQLRLTDEGRLAPSDDYLRLFLARPELAPVAESCAAELALHSALTDQPSRQVSAANIAALLDADARDNWRMFIGFRDALLAAGTLEAYYLVLIRSGQIAVPPLFIDLIVQAILRHLLDDCTDALQARAAEMLFRPQRLTLQDGRLLCGDRATLDLMNETGGLGDIGRLLIEAQAPIKAVQMQVLGADNGVEYWADRRYRHLLDLTHEVAKPFAEGFSVQLTLKHSGLQALARVFERWVQHLLGIEVSIAPLQRIDDAQWRWHLGLDVEATALLNDLYVGQAVDDTRMQRLLSLFKLHFKHPHDMRADVAGKPVYLGLAMTAEKTLRLKPQNLLLNLPLAALS